LPVSHIQPGRPERLDRGAQVVPRQANRIDRQFTAATPAIGPMQLPTTTGAARPAIVPPPLQHGRLEPRNLLEEAWRQVGFRAHQRMAGTQDAGLLVADRVAAVTQLITVVEADTGDD